MLALGQCRAGYRTGVTDVEPVVQNIGEDDKGRRAGRLIRRMIRRKTSVRGDLNTRGTFSMRSFQGNHEEDELGEEETSNESNRLLAYVAQSAREQKLSPSAVETLKKTVKRAVAAYVKQHDTMGRWRCQRECTDECWMSHLNGTKKHAICDLPDFTEKGQARLGAVAVSPRRGCNMIMPKPFQPGAWARQPAWFLSWKSSCTRQGAPVHDASCRKLTTLSLVAQVRPWACLGGCLWQGQNGLLLSLQGSCEADLHSTQQECWLGPWKRCHMHQVSVVHHSFN